MEIHVPAIERQKLIIKISKLQIKELTLLEELSIEKQKIYNSVIKKITDTEFNDCKRRQ